MTFNATASLELDITGPGQSDMLDVDGLLNMGGTLLIDLEGYVPQVGDVFDVVSYDSSSGAFTVAPGPNTPAGFTFAPEAGPDGFSVRVVTVPEPSALVMGGLFGLLGMRTRRRQV